MIILILIMKFVKLVIFSFILLSITSLQAQERDVQLKELFNKLKIDNVAFTYEVEQKIWEIWSTHPNDQELTEKLAEGSKLVRGKQLSKAINIFSEVIDLDPKWAEAWNKRATVLYMMGDYKNSQKDIDKVLELEQRHFGALAGQGLVNIKLENYEKAIESYKKVQEIYPTLQSPKIMIKKIKDLIKQNLI